ncbi:hypothetical protein MMC06_005187 [Schaereria dolodes]|nr:hypothetical protein [Schaereria dolodes]
MDTDTPTTTLNIPQLAFVLLLSVVIIRYFFFSPSSASTSPSSSQSSIFPGREARGRAADPRHVDQVATMFPQVGRREIQWDLQRNGGSVAATTERILSRGGLEAPPPSFQPPTPPYTPSAPSSTSSASTPSHGPDLITRYNLSSKLSQHSIPDSSTAQGGRGGGGEGGRPGAKKGGWSQNKSERQALLQQRREEMVLNARRKMEEKEIAERAQRGEAETES